MTTKSANDIVKEATRLGACSKSGSVTDWKSLVWLFFSPQGREFCEENNFPNIEMFREMKPYVKDWGVYVDAGNIELKNAPTVGVIGDTHAALSYSDNTKDPYAWGKSKSDPFPLCRITTGQYWQL